MTNISAFQPKFDMLRGVAALLVLVGHACQIYINRLCKDGDILPHIFGMLAGNAVLIFFLLSGYLVTSSIISNLNRNGKIFLGEYLTSRVARIYPPLIGTIILVFVCWAIIHGFDLPGKYQYGIATDTAVARTSFILHPMDVILALAMHNGMLEADGPLWSLYVEFIIYIAAIFFAILLTSKHTAIRAAALIIAISVCIHGVKINAHFLFLMFIWSAGALTSFLVFKEKKDQLKIVTKFAAFAAAVFLVFTSILNVNLILKNGYVGLSLDSMIAFLEGVVPLAFSAIWLHTMFVSKILDGKHPEVLVGLGRFSYSLYIIHFPLLLLVYSFTQNWMLASAYKTMFVSTFAIIFAIVFASIFAKFFENQRYFLPLIGRLFLVKNRVAN